MARTRTYRAQHPTLIGRMFRLGQIDYMIGRDQPDVACVRCYRKEQNVITIANLPLVFVLEQLADEVIMEELDRAPRPA